MKKRMTKKRMLALILSLVMVVGVTCHVSALEPSPSTAPVPESSANNGTEDGTSNQEKLDELGLEEEDLFITDEVARYIAEFFIRDMKATGNTVWDDGTSIVEIVPMYDETGENIVAYSAELTEGYITISAYIDMPSLILEWADEATPVYGEMKKETPVAYSANSSGTKIVYLGGLDYLLDDGDDTLETVDGIEVSRSELSENLSEYRDIGNVADAALEDLLEARDIQNQDVGLSRASDNNLGGYISNVFTYAENVYDGTWKSYDWINNWENYASYYTMNDSVTGLHNHCGPTAITNLMVMYGKKDNGASSYFKKEIEAPGRILSKVFQANNFVDRAYYTPCYYTTCPNLKTCTKGMYPSTEDKFVKDCFSQYGITVDTYGPYSATEENIRNASTGNRLMLMNIYNAPPFKSHAVVGFACNRIQNNTGGIVSFVKISDGHNNSGRYMEILSLSKSKYLEVYFPWLNP